MQPATQRTKTMTKAEVSEFLGKAKRRIEEYVAAGKLQSSYFPRQGGGRIAMFDRAEVEAFKRTVAAPRTSPAEPKATRETLPAVAPQTGDITALIGVLTDLIEAIKRGPELPPVLTVAQASAVTGYPRGYLLRRAREGWDAAVCVSAPDAKSQTWRFNREALITPRA
jgi:hypothetical protein